MHIYVYIVCKYQQFVVLQRLHTACQETANHSQSNQVSFVFTVSHKLTKNKALEICIM